MSRRHPPALVIGIPPDHTAGGATPTAIQMERAYLASPDDATLRAALHDCYLDDGLSPDDAAVAVGRVWDAGAACTGIARAVAAIAGSGGCSGWVATRVRDAAGVRGTGGSIYVVAGPLAPLRVDPIDIGSAAGSTVAVAVGWRWVMEQCRERGVSRVG